MLDIKIANIIKRGIADGQISGLTSSNVFTAVNASNEWKGAAKCYVTEGENKFSDDMTSASGASEWAETEVTLAVLGANRRQASQIKSEIEDYVFEEIKKSYYNLTVKRGDTLSICEGDSISAATANITGETEGSGTLNITFLDYDAPRVLEFIELEKDCSPRCDGNSFYDEYYAVSKIMFVNKA